MALAHFGSSYVVVRAFTALANLAPGSTEYNEHLAYINSNTVINPATGLVTRDGAAIYAAALDGAFAGVSTADLAARMISNLGLSGIVTQAEGVAYLAASTNRVAAVLDLAAILSNYAGTSAPILAAKAAYNSHLDYAHDYAVAAGNVNNLSLSGSTLNTFTLTGGVDALTGTAGDDAFLARTSNNANTLGDADTINGGAGNDTLFADLVAQNNAITPRLSGIENVVIRAQTTTFDATNGNNTSSGAPGFSNLVQIDAQRSLAVDNFDHVTAATGVTRWESNNSRSDVVIEDVRIGNDQKTSDVTIAFVESDPGNVDLGVYFDQQSLRNASSGTTTLVINLMDTGAAGNTTTAATPLLNNPYDQFKLGINGVLTTIQLDKAAVAAADTYEALLAVFQTALAGTTTVASLGSSFTITDPISNKAVVGKSIVLTGNAGGVITAPAGSGWFNTTGASVPPTSNIYTTFSTGSSNVTELVTSKVVLDDVGRSNMGGDLVIGGMSTGDTSNYSVYRGVERFEITVNDNSKLQTINSTNNALREVTIVNGLTSKTVADAYTTTVTNEGDLVVNGDAATNLALVDTATQVRGQSYAVPVGGVQSAGNNQMPGVENNSPVGVHHGAGAAGFTDVRLIDASAFKGKLGFTAAITQDTIAKYVNLIDVAPAAPAADIAADGNVNFGVRGANFIYTGGNDNDTMTITIDGAAASSRSSVISGQSDFTFAFNGGAGNDALTVTVINGALAGGAQAWYNNQKLNANIAIGAGDGDDVVRTPGAGDVIIDAGTGNDTVYTDNTGALVTGANSTGSGTAGAIAYANAAAAELAAAQAAHVLSNTTGFGFVTGTAAGAMTTPAGVLAALNTLDQQTAVTFPAAAITHAAIAAAIDAATAAGALTFEQELALNAAYNVTTGGVVTPVSTLVLQTITGEVAVAGNLTAAEFAAGNALLAGYITAAKAALATATEADANLVTQNALLDVTQLAVANAQDVVSRVWDGVGFAGTQVKVDGLAALANALVAGATDATAVTALKAAINNGSISVAQAGALFAAATANGAGAIDAVAGGELAQITAILSPLQTAAGLANTAALAALATATTNNTTAVNTAANILGTTLGLDAGNLSAVAGDSVGPAETAAAAAAAAAASTAAAAQLAGAQAINTALLGLKAAVTVGATDTQITNALLVAGAATAAGAVASGLADPLAGGVPAALFALASTAPGIAATVSATEKAIFDTGYDNALTNAYNALNVDALIAANTIGVDALALAAADAAALAAATATANTIAQAAAASGTAVATVAAPTAVFVFDTTNQTNTYNRVTADDRNLSDLKSDANNSYNFFNSTLKVTFKGIDSTVTVAGTGFKTSDLEINQSLKLAINSDAVLSKLLLATDGPANTLVVTSLIDGAQVTGNLAVTVTMPTAVNAADVAGASTAYGLAAGSTEAQVLAAINAAKVAFDTKGDYVTQLAESGAAAGNVVLSGANSAASTDNLVTLGTGNDVLVLSNTVGTDAMTSSNEKVVYSGLFGNDTIVNFAATGLGIDQLDFTALNGRGNVALNSFSLDKSIVIAAPAAVALTAAQIAALFTDSATAINHVYVAVDSTNIGSIWQVADAAGTAAGNVVATLVGTIDLADTAWGTLTAANFA